MRTHSLSYSSFLSPKTLVWGKRSKLPILPSKNGSQSPCMLGPRVMQSWSGRVPRVACGGFAYANKSNEVGASVGPA